MDRLADLTGFKIDAKRRVVVTLSLPIDEETLALGYALGKPCMASIKAAQLAFSAEVDTETGEIKIMSQEDNV